MVSGSERCLDGSSECVDERINVYVGYKPRSKILERGWWRLEGKDFRFQINKGTVKLGWLFAGKNKMKDEKGPGLIPGGPLREEKETRRDATTEEWWTDWERASTEKRIRVTEWEMPTQSLSSGERRGQVGRQKARTCGRG